MNPLNVRPAAPLRLISETRAVTPMFAHVLLRDVEGQARMFWHAGDQPVFYAAYGIAAQIVAAGEQRFEIVRAAAERLFDKAHFSADATQALQPRLFGGFAFMPHHRAEGMWAHFPPALFILPTVQVAFTPEGAFLTISVVVSGGRAHAIAAHVDIARRFQEYERWAFWSADQGLFDADDDRPTPQPQRVESPTTRAIWHAMIDAAQRQMQQGTLEKVVLARSQDVHLDRAADAMVVLDRLEARYPETYRFLFEPSPSHVFFGATPELLARVQGDRISTAAVAGSRPRGKTPLQDETLAASLLDSAKDRVEHAIVADSLRERLTPLAAELHMEATPQILRLKNIQHLYTPIEVQLHQPMHAAEVIGVLHPTPALGGAPREAAMAALNELEDTPRGWYAAPIGWLDAQGGGEFAVAIRSAVSVGKQARLYAGAGVVAESDADREWEETGWKFKPLMDALGVTADLIAEAEQPALEIFHE